MKLRPDWRKIVNPESDDLISGVSTAPGRVRTFLKEPWKGTTPHSCNLTVYRNDLGRLLRCCARDLKGGAGEKVILDNFQKRTPVTFNWAFYLPESHPDYGLMTDNQKSNLVSQVTMGDSIYWMTVSDSMEENGRGISILNSWEKFIELAEQGKDIVVDLSELRPHGQVNHKGLMASGPIGMGVNDSMQARSFLSVYEMIADHLRVGDVSTLLILLGTLNETMRRGGFKKGIIVSQMDYENPNIWDYLDTPLVELPGGTKKGVALDKGVLKNPDLVQQIAEEAHYESLFLAKRQPKDIHANVCMGIHLGDRATCLIWRVNLGLVESFEALPKYFRQATRQLALLHVNWRDEVGKKANIYPPVEEDRQIALDVMGLANLLAINGISFQEFKDAGEAFLNGTPKETKAGELVYWLAKAYSESTQEADSVMVEHNLPMLERVHTVEPAQSHSYETKDLLGKTTCRGIWAPYARKVRRVSDTQKNKMVNHGRVETSTEVGAKLHQEVCELWYRIMKVAGRPHAISFDSWEPIDSDWIKQFLDSPLQTKYYSDHEKVDQSYMRKRAGMCDITNPDQCEVCAE